MGKLILSTRDGYVEERKFFLRFLKFKADKLKVFSPERNGGKCDGKWKFLINIARGFGKVKATDLFD